MTTILHGDTITTRERKNKYPSGGESMLWVWIAAIAVFLIIEAATVQLVTIWLAAGAVGGLITCAFNLPLWVQILTFVLLSAVMLIVTKPFVKRITRAGKEPTNADRYIGKQAVVTEEIDNVTGTGAAVIGGLEWTARTADGSKIPKDAVVTVETIEGAKLIVK